MRSIPQNLPPHDIARFWSKVDKRDPDECWLWKDTPHPKGYGDMRVGQYKLKAHRIAYVLHYGVSPGELKVCHTCDIPLCVNPAHLFLGTQKDNVDDMVRKGRHRDARGEKNGRAKVTAEQVRTIRQTYAAGGVSQSQLAKQYGLTVIGVSKLIRGENWSHIT